jgi:hypothetical protein
MKEGINEALDLEFKAYKLFDLIYNETNIKNSQQGPIEL